MRGESGPGWRSAWSIDGRPARAARLLITYTLPGTGSSYVTTTIQYVYDPLYRLTSATYSTGELFAYAYDAVGNRTTMTATTPLSGTVAAAYTYDAANRLTARAVSDGRAYTYTWSARGQLLEERTQGYPVRTFAYDAAGQDDE